MSHYLIKDQFEIHSKDVKMEEKDREVWVGENRIYLRGDNIVHFAVVGEIVDENMAIAIKEACLKLINMVEGKARGLIDLNKAGKQSSKARKIYR